MTVHTQNPREPRDFYHLFRPNTVIWIGRILPLLPWVILPVSFALSALGLEMNIDKQSGHLGSSILAFATYGLILAGITIPFSLKAGVFQYTDRKNMDEFEIRLVEKARLFTYRIMAVALLVTLLLSPVKGPIGDVTGGPTVDGLKLAIDALTLMLFTLPVAHIHWSLKPVPQEENIRPDPPFMTDEDVAKEFWRR
jgi:hypothetical protein